MPYSEEENESVRIDGVSCIARSSSGRAILCQHEDWDSDKWIPQSLIHDDSEVYTSNTQGVLIVPRWFAKKENLL